jgi:hypothetical protein
MTSGLKISGGLIAAASLAVVLFGVVWAGASSIAGKVDRADFDPIRVKVEVQDRLLQNMADDIKEIKASLGGRQ